MMDAETAAQAEANAAGADEIPSGPMTVPPPGESDAKQEPKPTGKTIAGGKAAGRGRASGRGRKGSGSSESEGRGRGGAKGKDAVGKGNKTSAVKGKGAAKQNDEALGPRVRGPAAKSAVKTAAGEKKKAAKKTRTSKALEMLCKVCTAGLVVLRLW